MGVRKTYSEQFDLIRTIEDRSRKLVAQELKKSYLYRRFIQSAQVINCYDVKEIPLYLGPPTMGKWMSRGDVLPDASSSSTALSYWTNRYIATLRHRLRLLEELLRDLRLGGVISMSSSLVILVLYLLVLIFLLGFLLYFS